MSGAEWKFLKSWLTKGTASYNKEVQDYFRDVSTTGGSATNPRAAARRACLIKADDSGIIALHKRLNFYMEVQQSHKKPEVYGLPTLTYQDYFKFKPQIKLFFGEDGTVDDDGYALGEGQISFRLMGISPETVTEAQVKQWAKRIKDEFALNGGYVWRKGREQYVYREEEKGYQFRILARGENDARSLITKVLSVENNTPDWSKLNKSQNASPDTAFPKTPGNVTILGKTTRKPRKRREVDIRFLYAQLFLHGQKRPTVLIDRVRYFSNAIDYV